MASVSPALGLVNEENRIMRTKTTVIASLIALSLVGCASDPAGNGPSSQSGFASAGHGLLTLILSPLQIAAGVAEGIASLPYYASTGLHDLNRNLQRAQAKVTLTDTYAAAYGKDLQQVRDDGDTGDTFTRMRQASTQFEQLLQQYGVVDAQHYILTSIDTAHNQGYTLFAVVYRRADSITVIDKYQPGLQRTFNRNDRLYYEPYARTVDGQPVDEIVDWGALATGDYATQKQQAMLLTLAANKVVADSRRSDYWTTEQRWISGDWSAVVGAQNAQVQHSMVVDKP